jgi:hypothetical protein
LAGGNRCFDNGDLGFGVFQATVDVDDTPVMCGAHGSLTLREAVGVPIAVLCLMVFLGMGIDAILHPRRYMHGVLRSGGDLLREWNELGMQAFGLVLAGAAGWMLYALVRSVWNRCFG